MSNPPDDLRRDLEKARLAGDGQSAYAQGWDAAMGYALAALAARSEPTCYCVEGGADGHERLSGTCWYRRPPEPTAPLAATPPAEGLREAPAEVLRRAAIYVLQLADRDISPLLGESLLRAIKQDGYTLAALAPEQPE